MDPALLPAVSRGAALSDLPPLDELAAITVPALVLALEHDPGHPVVTAEALVDAMPAAQLHRAGDLDALRTWPALVASFLADLG